MKMLRPTLVRRVTLALLPAFALVWLVLMARQFYNATDRQALDQNLQTLGDNVLASIAAIDNAGEARAIVAATSALLNHSYRTNNVPGSVLMELRDARGARLFFSPEGGRASLRASAGKVSGADLNGQQFRVYRGDAARWSLLVAAPQLSAWWLIRSMGGGLTVDMLIAFPFVLLPIWVAVARGLRPLQRLSDRIVAKGPDDLAALGFDPKYAELRPLTAALDRLLAQLRDKLAREHRFVQDAAHELRTPLAVVLAQAHVLVMTADPAQRVDAERRMGQAIARASHLIEQLLALAQIDHQATPAPHAADVAQLLRRELALLAPAAIARAIDLSLEAPDVLPHALDLHAFESIVHNLVGNALAYVQRGGQVRVVLQRRGGGLCLSVADDGPGIAAPLRTLVFDRFFRGSGHDAPGAGLGLAIVRAAAARLHGSVSLEAGIDGRGCTFVVAIMAPQ
ncbi:MAG: ATP-binding protein [Pseudomonadota bacterium]|nr:ATP-binding protein [Pseudomonadota bacterium]